jgi:hypothetical protein
MLSKKRGFSRIQSGGLYRWEMTAKLAAKPGKSVEHAWGRGAIVVNAARGGMVVDEDLSRGTGFGNPSNDVASYSAPGSQRMLSAGGFSFQA